MLTADLTVPVFDIPVASTAGFQVGDFVVIRTSLTQRFIDECGMTGKNGWVIPSGSQELTSPGRYVAFGRRITAIDSSNGIITIDVPTRYPMVSGSIASGGDNARVLKPAQPLLSEIGIEDLSIGMVEHPGTGLGELDYTVPGTVGYDVSWSQLIKIVGVENCWVRNVSTYKPATNTQEIHVLSDALRIIDSRAITVTDCDMRFTQYKGGGGNGYIYALGGAEEVLIRDCIAEYGRHNISFNFTHTSGNVFLRFTSIHGWSSADFHQYLSMSNLLDMTTLDRDFLETRDRSSYGYPAQGVTSSQSVFWNTIGLAYSLDADGKGNNTDGSDHLNIIRSEQFGEGYVIGTSGYASGVRTTDYAEGIAEGEQLEPQSLYLDQRLKRLGF